MDTSRKRRSELSSAIFLTMDNFFLRLILHLNKRSRSVGYIDDNYIVFDTKKKEHKTGHPNYLFIRLIRVIRVRLRNYRCYLNTNNSNNTNVICFIRVRT